jgi:hypothetical protein
MSLPGKANAGPADHSSARPGPLIIQNERVSPPEPNDFTARLRPRRSCLAVPGSNPRFLEKAQILPADEAFLDL